VDLSFDLLEPIFQSYDFPESIFSMSELFLEHFWMACLADSLGMSGFNWEYLLSLSLALIA
jgi:hypothetical protein